MQKEEPAKPAECSKGTGIEHQIQSKPMTGNMRVRQVARDE